MLFPQGSALPYKACTYASASAGCLQVVSGSARKRPNVKTASGVGCVGCLAFVLFFFLSFSFFDFFSSSSAVACHPERDAGASQARTALPAPASRVDAGGALREWSPALKRSHATALLQAVPPPPATGALGRCGQTHRRLAEGAFLPKVAGGSAG